MRAFAALTVLLCALSGPSARAQDSFKVEALKEGPPGALAAEIKAALAQDGFRVQSADGKTVADFWLRKAVPASGVPAGPKGAVCYPVLDEGELFGILRFPAEGHDYRDQTIAAGVYTVRFGLQPINGDHLGVSTYRDFALLVAAEKDKVLAKLPKKKLEDESAEAAGSSHPAVLMLVPVPPDGKPGTMVHDDMKDTWGAVVGLALQVKAQVAPVIMPVQLVLVGVAMN